MSDPYAIISLVGSDGKVLAKSKSSVVDHTLNPTWRDASLKVNLTPQLEQEAKRVLIEIW